MAEEEEESKKRPREAGEATAEETALLEPAAKTPKTNDEDDMFGDNGHADDQEAAVAPASEPTEQTDEAKASTSQETSEEPAATDTAAGGEKAATANDESKDNVAVATAEESTEAPKSEEAAESKSEEQAVLAPAEEASPAAPAPAAVAVPAAPEMPTPPIAAPAAETPDVVQPTAAAVRPTISVEDPNAEIEERGEVPSQYIGRVIGKGGEMIRDLQARSGCRMDVDQKMDPGKPRIITYRGTRSTVNFAKNLVSILCNEGATDADLPLGAASRKQLQVPSTSIGKIIGRGGEMIRDLQIRSQAKIQVDHTSNDYNPTTRQVNITGTQAAVNKAEEMVLFLVANPRLDSMMAIQMLVEDKTHHGGVWGSGPPYPNLPNQGADIQPEPQNQYGGGGYHQPQQQHGGGNQEMEVFRAAKMYMGRIIGQKGVTINDLQRRTGCDIQINQNVPPGHDCEITITGPRHGIESVKQMLREVIEMGPNHPYAGGGGGMGQQGNYYGGGGGGYRQQPQQGGYAQGGYDQFQQQQAPPQQYHQYQQPPMQQQHYGQAPPPQQQYYQQPLPQQQQHYGAPQYSAQQQQQQQPYMQQQQPYYQPQPAPAMAPASSTWKSATAGDGQVYYYNEVTGETQWDKPMGMM